MREAIVLVRVCLNGGRRWWVRSGLLGAGTSDTACMFGRARHHGMRMRLC